MTSVMIAPASDFASAMRMAEIFSKTKMIPVHFQGKPEDCFVALQMADRMKVDPMMALQNIYVVGGKPGLSGALIISLINNSGKLKSGIRFRVEGKDATLAVTAYGETVMGELVEFTASMAMAKAEGWDKNPKYRSMPEVMLRYRAATFLARFNFPEVILGMHSAEEWEDVEAAQGGTVQRAAVSASSAGTALLAAKAKAGPLPPLAPEPDELLSFAKPEHGKLVGRLIDALILPSDFRTVHGKALQAYLEAVPLPAKPGPVEDAIRAFLQTIELTPGCDLEDPEPDLPEVRDEA